MSAPVSNTRPDFGVDVESFVSLSGLVAIVGLVIAGAGAFAGWWALVAAGGIIVLAGLASALLLLRSSKRGKFTLREKILDQLGLRGDEHVLDLGSGRGAMLVGIAARLPAGSVTGVEPGNLDEDATSLHATCTLNARLLGVEHRVQLVESGLMALPFEDEVFDVVTAWLPSRTLRTAEGRLLAIVEAVRVLKPGGKLVFVDFRATSEYAYVAMQAELEAVRVSGAQWSTYPPVKVVTAVKPLPARVPDLAHAHGHGVR